MGNHILGLHHITAIAGDAQKNYEFYTKILGLRMVKKTVNFDDPYTYHFYFGNEIGSPGTILTFFPWKNVRPGKDGSGMATEVGYSVPHGSLEFWKDRFEKKKVKHYQITELFAERKLLFQDPDGLKLSLIETGQDDERESFENLEISRKLGIKGFHTVTLSLNNIAATAGVLTEIFGYKKQQTQGNITRYITDSVKNAAIVDVMELPDLPRGINAGGTNHHVAFRVEDERNLMVMREKVMKAGIQITEKINRDYFFSLYFREPGGVLFEIATDNPGFATDETVGELGSSLQLPDRYEDARAQIEKVLPKLTD